MEGEGEEVEGVVGEEEWMRPLLVVAVESS